MTGFPNIGDKVVLQESFKEHPYYKEYYFDDRPKLDKLMGKPVEVDAIGRTWGADNLGYCDITDGEIYFRVPLQFVEAEEKEI